MPRHKEFKSWLSVCYSASKHERLFSLICLQMQEVRVALPNVVHVVRMYSISGEWFVFSYTICSQT